MAANTPKKKVVKEDPRKTPSAVEAKIPGRVPLSQQPKKEAAQPQQSERDTITPRGDHPEKAVYVARDKKSGAEVSFDQWGRKLDSIGNVVHGDRQRAGDAGAKEIYRPPAPTPPAPVVAKPSPAVGGARSPWDRSMLPMGPPPQPNPGYEIGAGITPNIRGNNPNVLAPGGVDPATGQPFPTARNGMLQPEAALQSGFEMPQFEMPQWKPSWDISPLQDFMSGVIPMEIGGLSMPEPPGYNPGEYVPEGGIYDPQGPRRDSTYLPVENPVPRYVPQGGMYDPQGRRRR
jgi:hypothetical protein